MHRLHYRQFVCAWALIASSVCAPPAWAQNIRLDELGHQGFRIEGIVPDDFSGRSVSGAGDVNGDGLADLIVGVPGTGESYVVFGQRDATPVELTDLASRGFRIFDLSDPEALGYAVAGAGDVNADGLADLIVGAPGSSQNGVVGAGASFVVFGKTDTDAVDLASLGAGGFRIDGIDASDGSGASVSGAGDVNGDAFDDLIVSATRADPGGDESAGESYVVFGKADATTVALANLGTGGFRIDGIEAHDQSGFSVSGAGDVNGDGLADLIVGLFRASPGEAYVVFGKTDAAPVDLGNLGAGGFRLDGSNLAGWTGRSVSGAGDVNGDGLSDVIVGAPEGALATPTNVGIALVVFGKNDIATVALDNLGSGGFRMDAPSDFNVFAYYGYDVAGAGDVNGDGLADLIVGGPRPWWGPGSSVIVFGKTDVAPVDFGALGSGGIHIEGFALRDDAGRSVSGAGDVNGDGLADVIIGAPFTLAEDDESGLGFVVFGAATPPPSISVRSTARNGDAPRSAFGVSGDGSNDGSPDARAWIDFIDGSDPAAAASRQTITLTRSAESFPSPGADVSWKLETTREAWTAAELRVRYLESELIVGEEVLEIVFSTDGAAPFTRLGSVVNALDNTVSASITEAGYYFLGQAPLPESVFSNGFEPLNR